MRYNFATQVLSVSERVEDNFITIDNEDFLVEPIDEKYGRAKGGNSFIFRLTDPDGEVDSSIIKFSRSPMEASVRKDKLRLRRFQREIKALEMCRRANLNDFVALIQGTGVHQFARDLTLPYYVMEEADCDLSRYLEENQLSSPEQINLCKAILDSLQKLHELGIYHRDIKPDNILFFDDKWKFSDLGLIGYRDSDLIIDEKKERIGPFGYYSPEAINYALSLRITEDGGYFAKIDDKSDIYQLGCVFWYVFKQQIPAGQVIASDFSEPQRFFDDVVLRMLQYCKRRRITLADAKDCFFPIMRDFGLV